jgi:hypothetical protein
MEYGNAPIVLGNVDLNPVEMMCYLYLPIKMPNTDVRIPQRLEYANEMIEMVLQDAAVTIPDFDKHYVYITAKTLFVQGQYSGNRPGWHADGFGSHGDINYLWYDMNPTEFAVQKFNNIPTDDFESMLEMERQIDLDSVVQYPCGNVLRLDETIVHRVNPEIKSGMRTFIKISVSRNRFNLAGNSHNYLFDYNWNMHNRGETRNLDSNNKDYVEELM